MTNEPPPRDQPLPWPDVSQRHEETALVLFAIGLLLGVLRGVAIVVTGPGEVLSWIEAAYALLLHLGAGTIVACLVRALGAWLGVAERRAALAPGREAEPSPAEAPEPVRREDPARWRARLDAARQANDAARVLEILGEAPEEVDERELGELDGELGKWLLALVHRRLRSGPLQADLVDLVDRGSERFGHTREGASLRAALPTLRRGAGLCPRCAKPYVGVWEACPDCMGRPEPPPPVIPGLVAAEEDEPQPYSAEGRWFVDPDDQEGPDGRPGR